MFKKLTICLFSFALTLSLGTSTAATAEKTIKISLVQGADTLPLANIASQKFADEVQQKSNGAIEVRIASASPISTDQEVLESTQSGAVQIGVVSTMAMSNVEPAMQVFDLPYLLPSYTVAYKVLDSDIGKRIAQDLTKKGVRNLTYWEGDYRQLSNSERPIVNVEDVAGLKIGVPQTPILVSWLKALKATPAPVTSPELYAMLEQRKVDGQDNGILLTRAKKYYEVQPYYTLTNHVYTPVAVLINERFFTQLSDAHKAIIQDAARNARDYQREIGSELRAKRLIEMKQAGLKVSELSPQERGRFRLSAQPVYDQARAVIDQNLLQQIVDMQ